LTQSKGCDKMYNIPTPHSGSQRMADKSIRIPLSADLHRRVKVKSAATGRPITDVVREFLRRWVEEEHPIVLPDPNKPKK
jgi:hypothetical protein